MFLHQIEPTSSDSARDKASPLLQQSAAVKARSKACSAPPARRHATRARCASRPSPAGLAPASGAACGTAAPPAWPGPPPCTRGQGGVGQKRGWVRWRGSEEGLSQMGAWVRRVVGSDWGVGQRGGWVRHMVHATSRHQGTAAPPAQPGPPPCNRGEGGVGGQQRGWVSRGGGPDTCYTLQADTSCKAWASSL